MNSSVRSWLAAAAICGSFAAIGRSEEKPDKPEKPDNKEGGGINLPIPINHQARGVKLPYTDAKGHLQMNFSMEVVHRTDETHLQMEKLTIETYDDAGKPDTTFDLPISVYDVDTHVLTSDHPVTIHRADFQLTGETMEFNTSTRQGVLRGKVRMLIFNRDELSSSSKAP